MKLIKHQLTTCDANDWIFELNSEIWRGNIPGGCLNTYTDTSFSWGTRWPCCYGYHPNNKINNTNWTVTLTRLEAGRLSLRLFMCFTDKHASAADFTFRHHPLHAVCLTWSAGTALHQADLSWRFSWFGHYYQAVLWIGKNLIPVTIQGFPF